MLNDKAIYFILGRHKNEEDGRAAAFEIKKLLRHKKNGVVGIFFEDGGPVMEYQDFLLIKKVEELGLEPKIPMFGTPLHLHKIKKEKDFESFKKIYDYRSKIKRHLLSDASFEKKRINVDDLIIDINPLTKSFTAPIFKLVKKRNFKIFMETASLEDSWKQFLEFDVLNKGKLNSKRDFNLVAQLKTIRSEHPDCFLIVVRGKGHTDTLKLHLEKNNINYEFKFYKNLNFVEKFFDKFGLI
jgi:hypothetical protein